MLVCCELDKNGLTDFVLMLKKDVTTMFTYFGTLFIQAD